MEIIMTATQKEIQELEKQIEANTLMSDKLYSKIDKIRKDNNRLISKVRELRGARIQVEIPPESESITP